MRVLVRTDPVIARVEPVRAPFPDVAGDVVQPVAVGGEGVDGSGSRVAIGARVHGREAALEHVHAVPAAGLALGTPRVALSLEPAAGGVLPFGLRRQPR